MFIRAERASDPGHRQGSATAQLEAERRDGGVIVDHAAVGADDDVAHLPAGLERKRGAEPSVIALGQALRDPGDAEIDLVLKRLTEGAWAARKNLPVLGLGL